MQKLPILAAIVIFTLILAACADKPTDVTSSKISVISMTPTTAWRGDTITITGKNFGGWGDGQTLLFDTLTVTPFFVSDAIIKAILPATLSEKSYQVYVANKTEKVKAGQITISKVLYISSIQPATAWRGDTFTITGKNFGENRSEVSVFLDEIPSTIIAMYDKALWAIVPTSVIDKSYTVTVQLQQNKPVTVGQITMMDKSPTLSSIQPAKVQCLDTVSIYGNNFGTNPQHIIIELDNIKVSPIKVTDTCILLTIPSSIVPGKKLVTMKFLKTEGTILSELEVLGPQWGDFTTVILSFRLHGDSTFKVSTSSYQFTDTTVERTVALENTMVSGKLPASYSNGKLHYTYQFSNSEYIPDVPGNPKVGGRGYTNKSSFVATIDTFSKTISNVVLSTTHTVSYSSMGPAYPFSVVNGLEYNLVIGTYKEIENGIEILFSADALNMLPQNSIKYYLDGQGPALYQTWKFSKAPPYASDNFIKMRMLRPK
jgi:hypothetical protein